jgi:N-acyl-phosphatidylethanolamine-hydrolysing phospholipase D
MKRFLIVLLISLLSGCSNLSGDNQYASSEQASDPNFKDGIYVNNHIEHPEKSFFSFVKMRFFGDDVWHDPESQKHLIPKTEADLNTIKNSELSQVTWLGHSTFLIQHQGMNLLTDPIFSVRASPFSFAGPKRYTPVATKLSELPPIDVVVISHNHYDHLDEASIKALGNDPVLLYSQ